MANILIIGGGVSGLSAGIYAQMNGHSAVIYERHFKPGGNLTAWDRGGFHIDNCIHWLTGTNPVTSLYKMWCELGALGGVEVHQPEVLFSFEKDGKIAALSKDINKIKRDMLEISPEDKGEILSFIKAVKAMTRLNGIAGENNEKPSTLLQKIASIPALIKYYSLSTGDLAKRFKSPAIRGLFEAVMTDYFSALALIMVFSTFTSGNGAVPKGASSSMAERMAERFSSLGGRIRLKLGARKINIENGKASSVTLDDGSTASADYVVVATDPASAFGGLLDKSLMPKQLRAQYENPEMIRFSSYHCAFTCDTANLPFCGDRVLEVPKKHRGTITSDYIIIREFSHEPSFAPSGKNIIQAMIYCKEDVASEFIAMHDNSDEYRERKRAIASAVEDIILGSFPELDGLLSCLDVWTPATYKRYVHSEIGSWMSFALTPSVAPVKITNRIEGVKNVILATQWLQSPGGLPIAAESGRCAIKTISSIDKKQFRIKRTLL